jgi:CheY-like chemotaxis protein/Tfp pilus assembly protein PilZ
MGTIVVVEGPDPGQCYLANDLKRSGRSVVGAASAQDALAALSDPPSAAFVHLVGPTNQLSRACQELRRDRRLDHVALVVLGDGAEQAEVAFAAGADDFARPPGDARELAVRVASAESLPVAIRPRAQTVLVVDDDLFFRRSIADLLQGEGYRTLEASTGAEALKLLETSSPALAVVDLFMPDLGGVELVRMLRSAPRWQRLPVVAISGMRAAHEKGLTATLDGLQVHDFIEKRGPALETLAAVVDELLREDAERFRPPRSSVRLIGEFRQRPEDPWISAYVCNLGLGGAFLRTLVLPPPETMVHFRLDWGEGRGRMVVGARVAWTRPRAASGSLVGMGLEFAEVGSADRENLRALLYS